MANETQIGLLELQKRIKESIKGTFVDNFIHELQDYLESQTNEKILENLPNNTNLHFARFENNYAIR